MFDKYDFGIPHGYGVISQVGFLKKKKRKKKREIVRVTNKKNQNGDIEYVQKVVYESLSSIFVIQAIIYHNCNVISLGTVELRARVYIIYLYVKTRLQ